MTRIHIYPYGCEYFYSSLNLFTVLSVSCVGHGALWSGAGHCLTSFFMHVIFLFGSPPYFVSFDTVLLLLLAQRAACGR